MFIRTLEHSSIIYETPSLSPLLKLSWNPIDSNFIAAIHSDSSCIEIIDLRNPSYPFCELTGHRSYCNGIAWAPHSCQHLVSCGDDGQTLIWDLSLYRPIPNYYGYGYDPSCHSLDDPILSYTSPSESNYVQWDIFYQDWVSISFGNTLQILRV